MQVERPEEIADHIRDALKFIPVERLVISTDCGMGREGMSRRHAFFKMVALVQGTNIVRRELGLPVAECPALPTSAISWPRRRVDNEGAARGAGSRASARVTGKDVRARWSSFGRSD